MRIEAKLVEMGLALPAQLRAPAGFRVMSTALAVLGDLKRELGDLDRVTAWLRILGMVNSAPGFIAQPQVIDGFTDLMVALYGEEAAVCPRAVAGMAELPLNSPVIIEGEVQVDSRL